MSSASEASLPKLLQALALGVKAVHSIPTRKHTLTTEENDPSVTEDEDDDDEFAYLMAFPDFSSVCFEARNNLVLLLQDSIRSSSVSTTAPDGTDEMENSNDGDFDDPILWERAAEACEVLLERVDVFIQNVSEQRTGMVSGDILTNLVRKAGKTARMKADGGWQQISSSLVDMEKPQKTYDFAASVNNSRTEPFVPRIHPMQPFKITPISHLEPLPGHGLQDRKGLKDIIAPEIHYGHPYHEEIQSFQYTTWQLEIPCDLQSIGKHGIGGTLFNPNMSSVQGVWIDTENELAELVERFESEQIREIAVDLEAHSYRSFSGFVCLMQISIRRPVRTPISPIAVPENESNIHSAFDFLIDTLKLRKVMNQYLAPIFANPNILKVMHGADSDVPWLQRDFGIYIVNLFDTGRACRLLRHLGSFALSNLLLKFADVEADKRHQLSDWRQRPLPNDMRQYAVSDTSYLLDIYDKMKLELARHNDSDITVESVLNDSRKVCLIRYDKDPFNPSGYTSLINSKRANRTVELTEQQINILRFLYDWRDQVARVEDESIHYVCNNAGLLRIATHCPHSVLSLQRLINPLPPLVLDYANDIIDLIRGTKAVLSAKVSESLMTNKADLVETLPDAQKTRSTPILDSNSLYLQTGWRSPQLNNEMDEDDGVILECKEVEVHPANKNFVATTYTNHSIEMSRSLMTQNQAVNGNLREKMADGLGAAMSLIRDENDEIIGIGKSVKDHFDEASNIARNIRKKMHAFYAKEAERNLQLNINVERCDSRDQSEDEQDKVEDLNHETGSVVKDLSLPKSLKEIYRMSNTNRSRAKENAGVKICLEMNEAVDTYDVDNITGAEAVLATAGRGGGAYFDTLNATKRQRAGSSVDRDNVKEPQNGHGSPVHDDTSDFVQQLGWISNDEEFKKIKDSVVSDDVSSDHPKVETTYENGQKKGRKAKSSVTTLATDKKKCNGSRAGNTVGANSPPPQATFGLFDPKAPVNTNPFFAGAAISGGAYSESSKIDVGRTKDSKWKKNGPINDRPAKGGNKTFVYRK